MIYPRNDETNHYPLFKELIPEYTSKNTLLDYGGCSGNLISFSNGGINENTYTCIDVLKEGIELGQYEFPNSKFIHYNKHNQMYNVNGEKTLPFPLISSQDYIWSYSVFSHMILEDIIECILWMKSLSPKKIIASYLCNDGDEKANWTMNYFYNKRISTFGSCVDFRSNRDQFFYISDTKYGNEDCNTFIGVYNTNWLLEQFSKHKIKAKKIHTIKNDWPIPFLEII